MNKIIVFDIDGTICDPEHRRHFLYQGPRNWEAFLAAAEYDPRIEQTKEIYDLFRYSQAPAYTVGFVTARSRDWQQLTERWLYDMGFLNYDFLLMRKAGDFRGDGIVKEEILLEELLPNYGKPFMVFDDRKTVLENCWQKHGIYTLDVGQGKGDF